MSFWVRIGRKGTYKSIYYFTTNINLLYLQSLYAINRFHESEFLEQIRQTLVFAFLKDFKRLKVPFPLNDMKRQADIKCLIGALQYSKNEKGAYPNASIYIAAQQAIVLPAFINSFYQGIIILRPTMQVEQPVNSSRRIQRYLQTIVDKVGRQNFGLIIMIISQIIWPLSFVYPSQTRMNPVETNLMRAIVTLISHYCIIDYFGMSFSLKSPTNFRIMLLRNFITCIHQFALTGAPFFLPFSIVFTLNSSSVLFVFILDYFIFKVEINKQQAIGVILGFLGVLLTVNGQFFVDLLYPDFEKETKFENYVTDDPYIKLLAGIILIAANFGRAFSICITKWLKKVNGTQLSFYFGIILLFECSMLYPVAVAKPSELPVMEWSIIFSAIPQNIVQLLFLSALLLSKNTGILNLMCFVSIAVGYLVSLMRYQEKINLVCFAGVLLILYGLIKTIANRQKH